MLTMVAVASAGVVGSLAGERAAVISAVAVAAGCVVAFLGLARKQVRAISEDEAQTHSQLLANVSRDLQLLRQHEEALCSIWRTLPIRAPLPRLGGWCVSADTAAELVSRVLTHKPLLIVEFGSGASSVVLGYAAEVLRSQGGAEARVISFEHDADHVARTEILIRMHRLNHVVQVVHAPLERCDAADYPAALAYCQASLAALPQRSIGLLFVDGPPLRGAAAVDRAACVLATARYLAPGAMVFFDDADRDRLIIQHVAEGIGAVCNEWLCTDKGAAVLTLP
jgi:predicted O-methyltransferase YrrM